MSSTILLGCDPGWKTCGHALLKYTDADGFEVLRAGVDNPSESGAMYPSIFVANMLSVGCGGPIKHATVERFVAYQNVMTPESEHILMTIGGIREALMPFVRETPSDQYGRLHMYRAIDWKVALVKLLVKHTGFDNPSASLDKRFSIAAAKHILNGKYEFKTDHEADAVCLAAFPQLLEKYTPAATGKRR